jgi:hypothetical protein
MKSKLSFFNLYAPGVARVKIAPSEGIIKDDEYNDFPQYLIKLVNSSPTGKPCSSRLKRFVMGKGFQNPANENKKVNPEETLLQLHRKVSADFAFFSRFALLVHPTAKGTVEQIRYIPAEMVRWGAPDENFMVQDAYYNPFILTGDVRRISLENCLYPTWELGSMDARRIREDIKRVEKRGGVYKGHIFFFHLTDERNRIYSRPEYFAGEDYLALDQQIGLFHSRNVKNNFFLGGVMNVFGNPEQGIADRDGDIYTTLGEEFQKQMADSFSGAENAGSLLVNWIQEQGQEASVVPFQPNTHHEMFLLLNDLVEQKLSTLFGIPLILLGKPTAGKLGENQEIRNAIAFTNETTEHYRTTLETIYTTLFADLKGFSRNAAALKIQPIQDFTDLPDAIFQSLTPKQKEEYLFESYQIEPDESEPETEPMPEEETETTTTDVQ